MNERELITDSISELSCVKVICGHSLSNKDTPRSLIWNCPASVLNKQEIIPKLVCDHAVKNLLVILRKFKVLEVLKCLFFFFN